MKGHKEGHKEGHNQFNNDVPTNPACTATMMSLEILFCLLCYAVWLQGCGAELVLSFPRQDMNDSQWSVVIDDTPPNNMFFGVQPTQTYEPSRSMQLVTLIDAENLENFCEMMTQETPPNLFGQMLIITEGIDFMCSGRIGTMINLDFYHGWCSLNATLLRYGTFGNELDYGGGPYFRNPDKILQDCFYVFATNQNQPEEVTEMMQFIKYNPVYVYANISMNWTDELIKPGDMLTRANHVTIGIFFFQSFLLGVKALYERLRSGKHTQVEQFIILLVNIITSITISICRAVLPFRITSSVVFFWTYRNFMFWGSTTSFLLISVYAEASCTLSGNPDYKRRLKLLRSVFMLLAASCIILELGNIYANTYYNTGNYYKLNKLGVAGAWMQVISVCILWVYSIRTANIIRFVRKTSGAKATSRSQKALRLVERKLRFWIHLSVFAAVMSLVCSLLTSLGVQNISHLIDQLLRFSFDLSKWMCLTAEINACRPSVEKPSTRTIPWCWRFFLRVSPLSSSTIYVQRSSEGLNATNSHDRFSEQNSTTLKTTVARYSTKRASIENYYIR